jgi:hypothetical protein
MSQEEDVVLKLTQSLQGMAMFLRGPKSMCYYTVLREEVNVERIFARYALRAVCAAMLYGLLDEDKSATIDTVEMYQVLQEIFGEFMQGKEVVALTDYLMRTVAQHQGMQGVRLCIHVAVVHSLESLTLVLLLTLSSLYHVMRKGQQMNVTNNLSARKILLVCKCCSMILAYPVVDK